MMICNDAFYVDNMYAFHAPYIEREQIKERVTDKWYLADEKKKRIIAVTK